MELSAYFFGMWISVPNFVKLISCVMKTMFDFTGLEFRKDKRFYHVYTKGLEDDVIFRDRSDYVAGMNYVPIAIHISKVAMLVFVLMSNHVHFVIYATHDEATKFIDTYKRLISRYVCNKYCVHGLMRSVKTSCSEVDMNPESLMKLISYVLNNPPKAGIDAHPQTYEWGSGCCYFSNFDVNLATKPLSDLSVRESCRVLKSQVKLPGDMRLSPYGYISPFSYIKAGFVESLFRTPKSMQFYLSTSNRTESNNEGPIVFSDTFVIQGLNELLNKKYESLKVNELTDELRKRVMFELKKRFNCPPKQLARVLGVSLQTILMDI